MSSRACLSDLELEREITLGARTKFGALNRTTRPFSSLIAGTLSAWVIIAAQRRLWVIGIGAGLVMTALTMFGFVINDIADYRKDSAAGVQRPIARGELSRGKGGWFAAALLLGTYLLSAIIGRGWKVIVLTSVGLLLYSPLAQCYAPVKGACVAALSCTPLLYGSAVAGVRGCWICYPTLAVFVLGREIWIDAEELEGDRKAGVETIAALLGAECARRMGVLLMLFAATGLLAVAQGRVARATAIAALLLLVFVFAWPELRGERRIQLSRFPMLLGSWAIASGGS